ncbi:hypothetical protein LTR37_000496 [Vermiconidia calcicola]|uniref:Uncharacterized protein n=1 Tax=Vermiconidia calcicola TaxID=1690605 RepID=A0ACC3P1J8_9PEZI|nr:hypothetical protein LTR37_000496 [Vermiconidia calcicola]
MSLFSFAPGFPSPRGGPRGGLAPAKSTLLDASPRPQRIFIAGYRDLTQEEFEAHYHDAIKKAVGNGSSFLLYLKSKRDVPNEDITIYRSTVDDRTKSLPSSNAGKCRVITVPGGEPERLAVMSEESDAEIVWLYPGHTLADHGCSNAGDILEMRFQGPKEALRLGLAKSVNRTMNI